MSYTELKYSHPVGRKDYDCEWCGQNIPKGEKHMSRSYIFDGDFTAGRMHLECELAMKKSPSAEISEGWCFGSNERGVKYGDLAKITEQKT